MVSDLKSAVCDHVPAQVAQIVEAGGALFAGVGLLSRVCPQVDLQASAVGEAFPALRAGVRLLPRVNAQVNGQRGLFEKGLPTVGTNAGILAHVSGPVGDQVLGAQEVPAAEAAVKVLGDTRNEDVLLLLLLLELADIAGMSQVAVRPNKGHFYNSRRHWSGPILQLAASYQSNALNLPSHGRSLGGAVGEVQETVMGDTVIGR